MLRHTCKKHTHILRIETHINAILCGVAQTCNCTQIIAIRNMQYWPLCLYVIVCRNSIINSIKNWILQTCFFFRFWNNIHWNLLFMSSVHYFLLYLLLSLYCVSFHCFITPRFKYDSEIGSNISLLWLHFLNVVSGDAVYMLYNHVFWETCESCFV